ncbi:hypothetical protein F5Y12DRAFT_790643 [Xylaria sp. FL1777]|nr:hypothetical protein F5Y12DRAFT_790643 [Xylaria sp. FL1777]
MPYDSRFRRQRLQPALSLSHRQTRRPQDRCIPSQEVARPRGKKGLMREPSRISAKFSLSQSCAERAEDESRTSSVPTSSHGTSSPSKAQYQREDGSIDIPSHTLALQETFKPTTTHDDSDQGHIRIIHFDFNKHKPTTPGSESRPIKIEDSPEASSSSPIRPEKTSFRQEDLIQPTHCLKVPAVQHGYRRPNDANDDKGYPSTSSFMVLSGGLLPSTAVTTIIACPKASAAFLRYFLAAEKHWLKSRDHDIDPDIKFWDNLTARFNTNSLGYQIDTWLTARIIATTLCSQPYKTQVEKQLPQGDDAISCLVTAIKDCRLMSQRRRRQQQSRSGNIKTSVGSKLTKEDIQTGVLMKRPETLEDRERLLEVLANKEHTKKRGSEYLNDPEMEASAAGLGAKYHDKRKRKYLKPNTAGLKVPSTRDKNPRQNIPSNRPLGPETRGRNPSKSFKKRRSNKFEGGYLNPSTREVKRNWKAAPPSRHKTQDNDRLERRIKELERTIRKGFSHKYLTGSGTLCYLAVVYDSSVLTVSPTASPEAMSGSGGPVPLLIFRSLLDFVLAVCLGCVTVERFRVPQVDFLQLEYPSNSRRRELKTQPQITETSASDENTKSSPFSEENIPHKSPPSAWRDQAADVLQCILQRFYPASTGESRTIKGRRLNRENKKNEADGSNGTMLKNLLRERSLSHQTHLSDDNTSLPPVEELYQSLYGRVLATHRADMSRATATQTTTQIQSETAGREGNNKKGQIWEPSSEDCNIPTFSMVTSLPKCVKLAAETSLQLSSVAYVGI